MSAPAKINLFLKVIGKRKDGYHNIYSWFQAIDLADHLEIKPSDDNRIEIATNIENLPTGPDNLVHKAAALVLQKAGIQSGLSIKLWKNIPVGAGLGGGSSDAAACIKGVNRLFKIGLKRREMEEIGLKIGSDIPFFFSKGQAEVTGRGEKVVSISLPLDYKIALATAPFEISAAQAYQKISLGLTDSIADVSIKCCHQAEELFDFISGMANDLEKALLASWPELEKIRGKFEQTGARIVRVSGSGPTIFALYGADAPGENELCESFEGEGWGLKMVGPLILPA